MSTSLITPAAASARRGIFLALAALVIFAGQDAVSRHLTQTYAVPQLIMVRYWAFAVFAILFAHYRIGLKKALLASRPVLQFTRSLIIVLEMSLITLGLRYLDLATLHALFVCFPLMVTALSIPILGEHVGWRRWAAVLVGFIGTMIIIRPGLGVLHPAAFIPLIAAFMFAFYQLITRLVSRSDAFETSLLWMALVGCAVSSMAGPFVWRTPEGLDWLLFATIALTGILGHLLLVKALELTPAATLQPINFTMPVWAAIMGYLAFSETPDLATVIGGIIVGSSGLYVILREGQRERAKV